jgi:SAM-dependent methyltransferase
VVEHGFIFPLAFNDLPTPERESSLPLMGVTSRLRIPFAEANSHKLCFALGPLNAYSKCSFPPEALAFLRRCSGRTLLVFPTHSTTSSEIEFDLEGMIEQIEEKRKHFDTVRFCIYWADLLKSSPWVRKLAEHGNLVTVGHPWDPSFQENLRSHLDMADVVASNSGVSAIGYAAHLGKPIWLLSGDWKFTTHSAVESNDIRSLDMKSQSFSAMAETLGWTRFPEDPGPVQHPDIVTASSDVLSPRSLLDICVLGEELYALGLRSMPDIKDRLRHLLDNPSTLSGTSKITLRDLLEKSDASRAELEVVSRQHAPVLIFDPLDPQPVPLERPVHRYDDIKVDICCGERKPEGFVGVDRYAGKTVDIVHDLNKSFPFEDSTAVEVRCHDALEHLRDPIRTMNELWRICKNDALVDIKIPSTDGRGAFQDPTHVSFWNENSFLYYTTYDLDFLAHGRIYGFKGAFKMLEMKTVDHGMGIIQVHVKLQAIKPAP